MKTVTVIYTDDSRDTFNCTDVSCNRRVAVLDTIDRETIIIPYRNVYMIKVKEITE